MNEHPPIWKDDAPHDAPSAGDMYGSLVAASSVPVLAREDRAIGGLPLALVAGAVVALLGGLGWAAVGISTHYDVGILAWLIGAATGYALVAVAGGPVDTASQVAAGVFAAAAIMVGKYVIFVHQLREVLGSYTSLTKTSLSIGYLDGRARHIFFSDFSSIVRPIYILCVGLAFFAAYRMAGGGRIFGRRPF
jgi:hypothetical protein